MGQKSRKRSWRKLVKKLQRKRKRQKLAQQRDKDLNDAQLEKLKDPLYKSWLEQQETIESQKQLAEAKCREENEEQWLRRELLAQKQFKRDQLKRQAEEAKLEAERLKQELELKLLEKARQEKREAIKLQLEKTAKDFDDIMICMQEYLEDSTMKTPTRLDYNVQSRPGEKSCDFFDKTNCCRFGPGCSFNHKRPILSKIILIKHFFQHPLLEQQQHEEYSKSDSELELSERDLRDSYDEFCEDVWPVLEEFGSIRNFLTVRNVQPHLRGHVFVEYSDKRSALKAFTNLYNRYYASKRLNVEFSNIQQWRTGVCGMRSFLKGLSLDRKCLKGVKCNFLHIMKNVDNKYNKPIDKPGRSSRSISNSSRAVRASSVISWNSEDTEDKNKSKQSHNWRWSESPQIEFKMENKEQNSKSQNYIESKSISDSTRKRSRRSKSNSPKLHHKNKKHIRSNSPNLKRSNSIKYTSGSCSRHHQKSKAKYPACEKHDSKSNSKSDHKNSERRKSISQHRKR